MDLLTLASVRVFQAHDVCVGRRGGGLVGPPPAVPTLIELETRGKNVRAARDETKPLVSSFKTLGQLLTF